MVKPPANGSPQGLPRGLVGSTAFRTLLIVEDIETIGVYYVCVLYLSYSLLIAAIVQVSMTVEKVLGLVFLDDPIES